MNRRDLIQFEQFYAALLRQEAKARENTNKPAAEQLRRFADEADQRVEALRCGPLFDRGAA